MYNQEVINREKNKKKLVYTVWACLKAMTQSKKLKEESSNKNHNNNNYNDLQ